MAERKDPNTTGDQQKGKTQPIYILGRVILPVYTGDDEEAKVERDSGDPVGMQPFYTQIGIVQQNVVATEETDPDSTPDSEVISE